MYLNKLSETFKYLGAYIPFLTKDMFCKVCIVDFSVGHGGKMMLNSVLALLNTRAPKKPQRTHEPSVGCQQGRQCRELLIRGLAPRLETLFICRNDGQVGC